MEVRTVEKKEFLAGASGIRRLCFIFLPIILIASDSAAARDDCPDVRNDEMLRLGGRLTLQIFGGQRSSTSMTIASSLF
jgi:hypothetical protein